MTDQEHANEIHKAARALDRALNAAAQTGLLIDITSQPMGSSFGGANRTLKQTDWRTVVSVHRTAYFDPIREAAE